MSVLFTHGRGRGSHHEVVTRLGPVPALALVVILTACGAQSEEVVDPEAVEAACPSMGAEPLVRLSGIQADLVRDAEWDRGKIRLCRGAYPKDEPPANGGLLEQGQPEPVIPGGGTTAFEVVREAPGASFGLDVAGSCMQRPARALVRSNELEFYACPVERLDGAVLLAADMLCFRTGARWGWEVHLPADKERKDVSADMKSWVPERCF